MRPRLAGVIVMELFVPTAAPSMIVERVHLPDNPAPGRYNASGEADPGGNVFVVFAGPTAHVWAVFTCDLLPHQSAAMIFENVSGSGLLDSIVSQWIRGGPGGLGENFNEPHVGEVTTSPARGPPARSRWSGSIILRRKCRRPPRCCTSPDPGVSHAKQNPIRSARNSRICALAR